MTKKDKPECACICQTDPEKHREHHAFIAGLMEAADRLDEIKWGFIGGAIKSLGYFVLTALVVGLVILAKTKFETWGG